VANPQAFETQRDDLRNAEAFHSDACFPSRDVILNADGRMTCRLKFGANLVGTSHTHSAFEAVRRRYDERWRRLV
jgi:hypothetical protein